MDTTIISFPKWNIGPFTMDRFLVKDLGGISIAWYGVIICVAMVLACLVILRNATKKEGFGLDSFLDYFIITIPLGVIGARAMYVLANLEDYQTFGEAIAVWRGGLAIYGAVITGIITIFIIAKIKKHNVLAVYDACIPGLMLAQAIGRWGNFVNGEAHGTVTDLPWGMMVNGAGPYHPTFLYESLINLVGFAIVMLLLYRKKKFNGQIFVFYLIWYGIGRTLVEGLRTDSLYIGTLRLAQCIGVASALCGVALFVFLYLWKSIVPPVPEKAEEKTELPKAPLAEAAESLPEEKKEEAEAEAAETEEKAEEAKESADGDDH